MKTRRNSGTTLYRKLESEVSVTCYPTERDKMRRRHIRSGGEAPYRAPDFALSATRCTTESAHREKETKRRRIGRPLTENWTCQYRPTVMQLSAGEMRSRRIDVEAKKPSTDNMTLRYRHQLSNWKCKKEESANIRCGRDAIYRKHDCVVSPTIHPSESDQKEKMAKCRRSGNRLSETRLRSIGHQLRIWNWPERKDDGSPKKRRNPL